MIRVAFLLPHLKPGGAERCVVNWLGALDRSRFVPLLFLNRVEGAFLDLLPGDVIPVPMGGARAARLSHRIGDLLAVHRIDVAYSATNAMNLALLAARTDARRIVSEHTPPAAYLAEAKWPLFRRAAMRHLYPRADAIAVPTDRIGAELIRTLRRSLPVATIPNPVVGEIQTTRPAPTPTLRILSAGRLVPAKGFDTVIQACSGLIDAGHDIRLTICGEGPLRDSLVALAAGTDRIVIQGYADLPTKLRETDLFVLASRREGFGNVLVEAMAAGVPVLATISGGPETFITDGDTGFLTATDDTAALADRIVMLLDPVRRRAVIEPARAVARTFGIAASAECLAALLTDIAAARSTAA